MPGYELERFVNLSSTEKGELICSICQDIFRCPVVASCCLQTFCEDCITDWLKQNKSCPYDRKELNESQLTRPPRAMANMLGKLKIHCDYKSSGCKEIVALEALDQHLLKCKANPANKIKKCSKCNCEIMKGGHDCIKSLLEINRKANEEITKLKKQCEEASSRPTVPPMVRVLPQVPINRFTDRDVDALKKEVAELKLEKENFLKTIQDMANSGPVPGPSNSSPSAPLTSISEQLIFNEARKFVNSPVTIQNSMPAEMTSKILAFVKSEIREYNSMFTVCNHIMEKLNNEYGERWHCNAFFNQMGSSAFSFEHQRMIKLKFGKLEIEIYKTQYLSLKNLRQRLRQWKAKKEISIIKTDMSESMIAFVKKVTINAIEKSEIISEMTSEIKNQMETKFGGFWQCFVFSHFGNFGISHSHGKYIAFDFAELTLAIFQAIG